MAVHLTPALEQRLEHLANESHRSSDELAQEALESYLAHIEALIVPRCAQATSPPSEKAGYRTRKSLRESKSACSKPREGHLDAPSRNRSGGSCRYLGKNSPDSATRVAERIYGQVMNLQSMPHIGRTGLVPGTRELMFHPWPHIAVYRVTEEDIRVIRIRHASRQWPR